VDEVPELEPDPLLDEPEDDCDPLLAKDAELLEVDGSI
jgi:hypothetical protein